MTPSPNKKITISGLWIGKSLSLIERLCIHSFLQTKHHFILYTYEDVKNIPPEVEVRDGREIVPEKFIFTAHNNSLGAFSDWFRWSLLYKKGGIWVDMDMVALKPFDFKEDIFFGCESMLYPSLGVLKFPPKHHLASYLINCCKHPNKLLKNDSWKTKIKKIIRFSLGNKRTLTKWEGWGESGGPVGFKKALDFFQLKNLGESYMAFYPIDYYNWKSIFDNTFSNYPSFLKNSFGLHLWNEAIRRETIAGRFNINQYHPNSLFSYLLKKYNVDPNK